MEHITKAPEEFGLNTTFATLISVFAIRSSLLLKASPTFGPMIVTIMQMLKEVCKYIFLQGCIIFIFFISMRVMFYEIDEFSDLKNTFLTLVSASFGNYNFDIINDYDLASRRYLYFGSMMLFICISGIILMNLLIAIISNVYNKLNEIKIGLYLKSLIEIRHGLQDDPRYSCLVSGVVPFNFLVFLFFPIIIWFQSKTLNSIFLHYEYAIVLVLGTLSYLFLSMLILPIAYVVTLVSLAKDLVNCRSTKSKLVQTIDFSIFMLCGVVILFVQNILDLASFISNLYTTELVDKYKVEQSSLRAECGQDCEVDPDFYELLMLLLKSCNKKYIPAKVLINELNKSLDIYSQIRKLVFYNPDKCISSPKRTRNLSNSQHRVIKDDKHEFLNLRSKLLAENTPVYILKQYNVFKRIINNCSVPNKIRHDSQNAVKNLRKAHDDPIFNRQLTMLKAEHTNQQESPLQAFTENIFYVQEFLEMMKELNAKQVFRDLIQSNVHSISKIHSLTKEGYYRKKSLLKSQDQINLKLLRHKYEMKVPTKEQLNLIKVGRNYNCLAKYQKH